MISRQLIPIVSSLAALAALSGCGNKGDLFLIPDPVSQEDMEQFQRALEDDEVPSVESPEVGDAATAQSLAEDEVPVAEPREVDDEDIYAKPGKKDNAGSATQTSAEPTDNPVVDAIEDPNTDTSTVD